MYWKMEAVTLHGRRSLRDNCARMLDKVESMTIVIFGMCCIAGLLMGRAVCRLGGLA